MTDWVSLLLAFAIGFVTCVLVAMAFIWRGIRNLYAAARQPVTHPPLRVNIPRTGPTYTYPAKES